MKNLISGKTILVTGGTGSFGSLFVRKILKFNPREIIVFSRDEDKQGSMRIEYKKEPRLRFVLGDIREYRSVHEAMWGVDIVIHAAALKWIPEVEYNVWEGIKTNVVGAQNIIEAARSHNVEKVVALSTDKAVEPINAYGMAKALQERLITTSNLYDTRTKTVFVSTRYGNVLGSRGSVVPYFNKLISEGKPVTVTDPEMTRFLMTLDQSVDLVLYALEKGVGGEVFVPRMPAHTIGDLVDVLYSNTPRKNRKFKVIGVRPGEKIHETLVGQSESTRTIEDGPYYIILPQIPLKAIEKKYVDRKGVGEIRYASDTTHRMSKTEIKRVLQKEGWM